MLSQKLCLVTGAGAGIGKAICHAFAKQGAIVIAADINKSAAESTASELPNPVTGEKHLAIHVDVTSRELLEQLRDYLVAEYKTPPQVLVNNAGITLDKSFHKMSDEQYDWVLNVNLKGPFLISQIFTKALVEQKLNGSVINISSIVGKTGNFGQANYASAKAGLLGLTKTVAREMGRFDIRCNAILPGFIETEMAKKVPEPVMAVLTQLTPLGRQGLPEEVANACVFLASDMSSFVTGACLEVTGGLFA